MEGRGQNSKESLQHRLKVIFGLVRLQIKLVSLFISLISDRLSLFIGLTQKPSQTLISL